MRTLIASTLFLLSLPLSLFSSACTADGVVEEKRSTTLHLDEDTTYDPSYDQSGDRDDSSYAPERPEQQQPSPSQGPWGARQPEQEAPPDRSDQSSPASPGGSGAPMCSESCANRCWEKTRTLNSVWECLGRCGC